IWFLTFTCPIKGVCILIGDCCVFSVSNGAVVTLDPNWSEIYTGEKITLRCEIHRGDTEWEYEWRKSDSALSETESEIRITKAHSDHTGDYSFHASYQMEYDIILESPVHPVTEGQPLILSCRLWTDAILADVSFYKNGKVIQNGTSEQLSISAVSKSDEGFYKCERKELYTKNKTKQNKKHCPPQRPFHNFFLNMQLKKLLHYDFSNIGNYLTLSCIVVTTVDRYSPAVLLYIHGFCCFSCISANTVDTYASSHPLQLIPLL
uniref:Ig-like domain-containing protein n=1 Tax=Sphaeramia orbicularis TaxID=375764 RepID=A0A672Y762_9TELE